MSALRAKRIPSRGGEGAAAKATLAERSHDVHRLTHELQERQRETVTLRAELSAAQMECQRLATVLDAQRDSAAEQLARMEQMETRFRDAFAVVSQQARKLNGESFLDLARATLGECQQAARTELEQRHKSIAELVHPVR